MSVRECLMTQSQPMQRLWGHDSWLACSRLSQATVNLAPRLFHKQRTYIFQTENDLFQWAARASYDFLSFLTCLIPLLLSKSPQFACIYLSHSLIYVVSFVFRATWHGSLLSSQFLGNRAGFQIGPLLTRSSDRTHFLLSLAPSRFSIKCSVVPYPIPNVLFSSSPMSSSLSIAEYFSLASDSIQ